MRSCRLFPGSFTDGTPFDIALPLTGPNRVESRSGGAANAYEVIFTFAAPVTFTGANVTLGIGQVSSTSGSGTAQVTVDLTGVTNAQDIIVPVRAVNDGTLAGDVSVPLGLLIGDSNDDGLVNSADATQVRSRSGQTADSANFRADVNADGTVNSSDVIIVRSRSGTALPYGK